MKKLLVFGFVFSLLTLGLVSSNVITTTEEFPIRPLSESYLAENQPINPLVVSMT